MTKGFKFKVLTTIGAGVVAGLFAMGVIGSTVAQAVGGSGCACSSGADCSVQGAVPKGSSAAPAGSSAAPAKAQQITPD